MTINKYKPQIIGAYILVSIIFSYKGSCQSYSVINLDKIEAKELPAKQKEMPIPDSISNFNDIIKIKSKSKTTYMVDYIPSYEPPIISKETVFVNLDHKLSAYNLESATEISNENKPFQYRYKVFEFEKKKLHQSLLGKSYDVINYLSSIDQTTGDTLWIKQGNYLTIHQTNTVSYVEKGLEETFIIDNKTGKELYKLIPSDSIAIMEAKEDAGYLYLLQTGELIAINLQKGEVVWKVKGNFNGFFIDETRIYTSNQCAIDKKTGKLIWNNNSDGWIVGCVGDYLIGYSGGGEDDPELYVYDKNTGKLTGYLWSDDEFCTSCLGYEGCYPEFIFAEQGEGNKTAALIKCKNDVYLYTFEVVGQN